MPTRVGDELLVWGAENIEPQTIEQARRAARLPFVRGHVALMPDAHFGMGSTIGSVIPTEHAIIPAAVGVDIGCGMAALETNLHATDLPGDLQPLLRLIAKRVPSGVGQGFKVKDAGRGEMWLASHPNDGLDKRLREKTVTQFGTLGSGNHFIELCVDERDAVWIMLHSGSRGVGNLLAQRHIKVAQGIAKRDRIALDDRDLAYLVEDTPEFDSYITDLLWAQAYAAGNRDQMLKAVFASLVDVVPRTKELRTVNTHHNYSARERHFGADVWITRKGAIKATKGDLGIIPGSMGTRSYIVEGLGNPDSYNSCSHGAGRAMSRTQARKQLTPASLTEAMGDRTWLSSDAKSLVDEHPLAYKDIDEVMDAQRDLVRVLHTLRQVLNYKGT